MSVIGSRLLTRGGMPVSRFAANLLLNAVTFLVYRKIVSDSQSGFKAFTRQAVSAMELNCAGYEICSEIIGEIYRKDFRYKSIPVSAVYTPYSRAKGQHFLERRESHSGAIRAPHEAGLMFVLFSKIFALVLAAIAISKSYVDFKSRTESLKIFLFWVFTWLVIVFVALFPSIVDYIIGAFGAGRAGLGTFFGMGLVFLYFLAYRIYVKIGRVEQKLMKTVQELALREVG